MGTKRLIYTISVLVTEWGRAPYHVLQIRKLRLTQKAVTPKAMEPVGIEPGWPQICELQGLWLCIFFFLPLLLFLFLGTFLEIKLAGQRRLLHKFSWQELTNSFLEYHFLFTTFLCCNWWSQNNSFIFHQKKIASHNHLCLLLPMLTTFPFSQ